MVHYITDKVCNLQIAKRSLYLKLLDAFSFFRPVVQDFVAAVFRQHVLLSVCAGVLEGTALRRPRDDRGELSIDKAWLSFSKAGTITCLNFCNEMCVKSERLPVA